MEQRNDSLREQLLSRLPQPGDLKSYREETASLLAKHEKAIFWERWSVYAGYCIVGVFMTVVLFGPEMHYSSKPGVQGAEALVVLGLVSTVVGSLRLFVYRGRVEVLKEIKQVQLQVLELQASLQRDRSTQV